MSNLPLGAESDPRAPYNLEEKVFKVDFSAKALYYHEYIGTLDSDAAIEKVMEKIQHALSGLGDFDILDVDVEVS